MKYKFIIFKCLFLAITNGYGQINLVSTLFTPNNISQESLLNISLDNVSGKPIEISIDVALTDGDNRPLFSSRTTRFTLPSGVNFLPSLNKLTVLTSQWQNSDKANYIKNNQLLPSGLYHVCYKIVPYTVLEVPETFCEDITSEGNSFLMLVNPNDEDTIETTRPTLVWNHSETFSLGSASEFYRLLICEKSQKESGEEAITKKLPIVQRDFLNVHQINYSNEQKELEKGKTYAWQVLKICNGITCQQSDVWQFTVKPEKIPTYVQYAELALNRVIKDVYVAKEGMVFFRFEDFYDTDINQALVMISDGQKEYLHTNLKNLQETTIATENNLIKGFNQFKIDLQKIKNLKKGVYTLEVKNQKLEVYTLKIYYEG
jgi:hypothetical protein